MVKNEEKRKEAIEVLVTQGKRNLKPDYQSSQNVSLRKGTVETMDVLRDHKI